MPALQLFIIYAREDQPALLELKAHLRPLEKRGDLTVWYDGEILPGADWDKAIKAQLATADIVLLFISKSFFNSEYIEKEELKKALERHKKGEAVVVPVIVKPCYWEAHDEIAALQVLPKDGKAVVSWADADEAWVDVVKGVQKVLYANNLEVAPPASLTKIKVKPENGEFSLAYQYCKSGYYDKAYKIFKKYGFERLEVNSDNAHAIGLILSKCNKPNRQTYSDALTWCQTSAIQGNPVAQNYWGIFNERGMLLPQNFSKAVEWYRKAAKQGDTYAQFNLGNKYKNGEGVGLNYLEAVNWYREASDRGNADAQVALGMMYEKGIGGLPKDLSTAASLYKYAAQQDHELGKANLKRLGYTE